MNNNTTVAFFPFKQVYLYILFTEHPLPMPMKLHDSTEVKDGHGHGQMDDVQPLDSSDGSCKTGYNEI